MYMAVCELFMKPKTACSFVLLFFKKGKGGAENAKRENVD